MDFQTEEFLIESTKDITENLVRWHTKGGAVLYTTKDSRYSAIPVKGHDNIMMLSKHRFGFNDVVFYTYFNKHTISNIGKEFLMKPETLEKRGA